GSTLYFVFRAGRFPRLLDTSLASSQPFHVGISHDTSRAGAAELFDCFANSPSRVRLQRPDYAWSPCYSGAVSGILAAALLSPCNYRGYTAQPPAVALRSVLLRFRESCVSFFPPFHPLRASRSELRRRPESLGFHIRDRRSRRGAT